MSREAGELVTDILPQHGPRRSRIDLLDVLRGLALLAMASYHFTWDLDFHGFIARGTANTGFFHYYARSIATSFLLLVGVSLVLAHARAIRWRPFAVREAQIVAGALAVSVATFVMTPGSFVFFGILHQIAVASLVGLLFLRLPAILTAAVGAGMIALPFFVATAITEPRWLAWIGLAAQEPASNDYVPVLPWTGVVLLGIALARLFDRRDAWARLAALNDRLRRLRPLGFLGRHSLLFYLLHQPVLFGLVAAAAFLIPPDQSARFAASCREEFRAQLDGPTLGAFCDCVEGRLRRGGLLERLMAGRTTDAENQTVRQTSLQCSFDLRDGNVGDQ